MKPNCASSTNARILLSNTLSIIFMPCSCNFTLLYEPQFITSSFPLKIGTTTLVFHSSGIPFYPKLVGNSTTCNNYLCCYFREPRSLFLFHFSDRFSHFLRETFSTGPSTIAASALWSQAFSSFIILSICSFHNLYRSS